MSSRPPNILFITTDQQRQDSLPCYGMSFMRTAAIDRLAAEGVVFDNALAVAPVCQPCRAAFVCGQYPFVNGVAANFQWLRPGTPTIADAFRNAGWKTAAIGKMHFHEWDDAQGFEHRVIAEDKRHFFRPDHHAQFVRQHGFERGHPAHVAGYGAWLGAITSPLPGELHIDSYIGTQAVRYLEQAGRDPFFCWVSFNSPHDPYDPPAELAALYRDAPIPEAVGGLQELEHKPAYQRRLLEFFAENPLYFTDYRRATPEIIRRTREHYLATVSLVDEQIGRILDTLEQRGLSRNTLIVFSSDHGDELGDHGLPYKGTFYEGSLKVPLIVCGPGVTRNRRCRSFVDWVDLHRTFLEIAGIRPGAHVQGQDLRGLLHDPAGPGRTEGFSELLGRAMVSTDRYKLVLCDDGDGELYDLQQRPLEVHNHFHDPDWKHLRTSLGDTLMQRLLSYSRVTRFGGGAYPSDQGRDRALAEARRVAALGGFAGLTD